MPDIIFIGQAGQYHLQPVLLHHFHHLEGEVVWIVQELDWTRLEEHCFEFV